LINLSKSSQANARQKTITIFESQMGEGEEILCPCPVCGMELAELDGLWREVHVRDCMARGDPWLSTACQIEKCDFCGKKLFYMSAELANRHVNECMDQHQKRIGESRLTDRCVYCGQNIKDMGDRQRKIHNQTCQGVSRTREAEVIAYPKVVESVATPAEWEIEKRQQPNFVASEPLTVSEVPRFGRIVHTWDLQNLSGYEFRNSPYVLGLPPGFSRGSEIDLF
jgi:hypothetical protein